MCEITAELFMCRQKERVVVVSTQFDELEKIKDKLDKQIEVKKVQYQEYTNPIKVLENVNEEFKLAL
jgi:hypothetical protein